LKLKEGDKGEKRREDRVRGFPSLKIETWETQRFKRQKEAG
jgi:hypothetical protein